MVTHSPGFWGCKCATSKIAEDFGREPSVRHWTLAVIRSEARRACLASARRTADVSAATFARRGQTPALARRRGKAAELRGSARRGGGAKLGALHPRFSRVAKPIVGYIVRRKEVSCTKFPECS